jgi:hypothetical protein
VRGDATRAGRRDAICTSMISREAHTTLVELSACQDLPVLGARPAGDTAWKRAGFRAPMAAIRTRSGKAEFLGAFTRMYTGRKGEPQLAMRPDVHACTVYRAIEAGMPVPRPAWRPCAKFSGRLRLQFGAVKRVFLAAFSRMYTGRKGEPQLALRPNVHACKR